MARLEKLNSEIDQTLMDMSNDQIIMPGSVPNNESQGVETADESIHRAVLELRINRNPEVAIEHEEFIANLTRKALKQHCLHWLTRRKKDTEAEVAKLSDRVQHLQRLYEHQDTVLSRCTALNIAIDNIGHKGEVLGSAASELEVELDRVRSYRDTLYSGELLWREASRLTQAGSALARAGSESWSAINTTLNADTRFRLATDCRNAIHEATMCIQTAQSILPGVQFPYCTAREINALLQVIEYLYTDMQVVDRYTHASEAYSSFQKRAAALHQWIRHLMEQTIRKDVLDVDKKITELSTRLCNERANLIRQETGLMVARDADSSSLSNLVKKDFKKKVMASNTNAWNSRRIEDHVRQQNGNNPFIE